MLARVSSPAFQCAALITAQWSNRVQTLLAGSSKTTHARSIHLDARSLTVACATASVQQTQPYSNTWRNLAYETHRLRRRPVLTY
jgi:hypothetical protein